MSTVVHQDGRELVAWIDMHTPAKDNPKSREWIDHLCNFEMSMKEIFPVSNCRVVGDFITGMPPHRLAMPIISTEIVTGEGILTMRSSFDLLRWLVSIKAPSRLQYWKSDLFEPDEVFDQILHQEFFEAGWLFEAFAYNQQEFSLSFCTVLRFTDFLEELKAHLAF